MLLTVFQLWSHPKKKEQFLPELDEHSSALAVASA